MDNNSYDKIYIVRNNNLENLEIKIDNNRPNFQKIDQPEPRENFGYYRLEN